MRGQSAQVKAMPQWPLRRTLRNSAVKQSHGNRLVDLIKGEVKVEGERIRRSRHRSRRRHWRGWHVCLPKPELSLKPSARALSSAFPQREAASAYCSQDRACRGRKRMANSIAVAPILQIVQSRSISHQLSRREAKSRVAVGKCGQSSHLQRARVCSRHWPMAWKDRRQGPERQSHCR